MPKTKLAALLVTAAPPEVQPGDGAYQRANEGAFTKVDGRECILRSAELFVNRDEVAQVLTCFDPGDAEEARRKFGGHLAFSGAKIAESAEGWYGQIQSMASRLEEEVTHVLVHDAARPAVAFTDLDALAEGGAGEPEAVHALAVDPASQVVEIDGKGAALDYRPAAALRLLLWPRLYPKADLATLAGGEEPPAQRLRLVEGFPLNIRCNGPGEAKRLQAMLKLVPQPKKQGPLSPFEEAQW